MIQHTPSLRLAAALLLGATALTPALAQNAQPAADPAPQAPTTQTTPLLEETTVAPPVVTPPTPISPAAQSSEPVINTRASGNEPADPAAQAPAATRSTARPSAPRSRTTSAARPRAATRPAAVTAAPVEAPPAPVAAPEPVPEMTAPPPVAAAPVEATPAPAEAAPAADLNPGSDTGSAAGILPWLLAAAVAIGALLLLASRRRRRAADDTDYAVADEPVAPLVEPVETIPVAAAAAIDSGRPWLDLAIRPVRAGVSEDAARVEFELAVENNGSAPAQDVRISTWLMNGNAPEPSEMERMLIKRPEAPQRLEGSIAPGDGTQFDTAVVLPRAGLEDAILPVVAAEARYRLPDGSEGRTAASFAVGVARGEELVMFDVDNPSGLHDGVEARLHGEPRRD